MNNHQKLKSDANIPPNFRFRKVIHYFLIASILVIQLLIAGFFYNEFFNKPNNDFVQKQLKDLKNLERLTNNSRNELFKTQENFLNFLVTEDQSYLQSYQQSSNELTKNFDKLNHFINNNTRLRDNLKVKHADSIFIKEIKAVLDTVTSVKKNPNIKNKIEFPNVDRFVFDNRWKELEVETQIFSDTIKKKGLLARLRDAVTGDVDVRKDSVVVNIKEAEMLKNEVIKGKFDSIMKAVNEHYLNEIREFQVQVNNVVIRNNSEPQNNKFDNFLIFNTLVGDSNELIDVYELAISDSRLQLQKELDKQNSKRNKIRNYIIFSTMILMFIVSILIMFLTRIAFDYEKRLNEANIQIKENLNFKNRILGMLSHELRSPLKIIDIFIKRINKKTEDQNIKDYLKSISFTNKSLLMQSNQILEYTKNQQVENKLVSTKFYLKDEIQSILNSIQPYIESHNNKLVVNDKISEEIEVYSDNQKMNQIFMNILGNANKFTENGTIEVTVSTEKPNEKEVTLHAVIKDSGVGISQSDLKNIFEPYYQGIISEKIENLGAGLGLSLCKELVELYSGKIAVSSEVNKGTEVSFSLNLNQI